GRHPDGAVRRHRHLRVLADAAPGDLVGAGAGAVAADRHLALAAGVGAVLVDLAGHRGRAAAVAAGGHRPAQNADSPARPPHPAPPAPVRRRRLPRPRPRSAASTTSPAPAAPPPPEPSEHSAQPPPPWPWNRRTPPRWSTSAVWLPASSRA